MKQASEAVRLVAFLNTLHIPDLDDQLGDDRAGPWLSHWLGEAGEGHAVLRPGACGGLRDLREGVRQLVAARDGVEADPEVAARAAGVLRGSPFVLELGDERSSPRLAATGDPGLVGHATAAVAAAYLAVRSEGGWPRVKVCAAEDCRWAFLDTSRNGARRWCDMSDCGNRAKNRVWRERQRSKY